MNIFGCKYIAPYLWYIIKREARNPHDINFIYGLTVTVVANCGCLCDILHLGYNRLVLRCSSLILILCQVTSMFLMRRSVHWVAVPFRTEHLNAVVDPIRTNIRTDIVTDSRFGQRCDHSATISLLYYTVHTLWSFIAFMATASSSFICMVCSYQWVLMPQKATKDELQRIY